MCHKSFVLADKIWLIFCVYCIIVETGHALSLQGRNIYKTTPIESLVALCLLFAQLRRCQGYTQKIILDLLKDYIIESKPLKIISNFEGLFYNLSQIAVSSLEGFVAGVRKVKYHMLISIITFIVITPITILLTFANFMMSRTFFQMNNITLFFVMIFIISLSLNILLMAVIPKNYFFAKFSKNRKVFIGLNIAICFFTVYQYLSITVFDYPERAFHEIKIGMPKSAVEKIIGKPDYFEGELWAYELRGQGFGGLLMPMYLQFDNDSKLERMYD